MFERLDPQTFGVIWYSAVLLVIGALWLADRVTRAR